MAATFVVEDGTGLETANSYISVADADSYVENHGADAGWTAANQATKENALRLATQYLDLEYGSRFKGIKTDPDNALCWPRYNVTDPDGWLVDDDSVPGRVEQATVEAAIRIIAGDSFLAKQSTPGTIKRERKKLAVIEKEVEYVGGKSQVAKYPKIAALLQPLLKSLHTFSRG